MSNEPRPSSEAERTDNPLVIECDYNTNRQNLTFYSARECSYDELRAKIKESFKFTARPFKLQWEDGEGEKNCIQNEATLDDAIDYHRSTDGSIITILVKISLEYDGPSHLGAPLLASREADSAEGWQISLAGGESSGPQQNGDAVTTSSKSQGAGKSAQNSLPWKPSSSRSHILNADSYAASSIDEVVTGRGIINGSTGGRGSYNLTGSARRDGPPAVFEYLRRDSEEQHSYERSSFQIAREWAKGQAPHQMFDAHSISSLNTDSPLSDTSNPPERSQRRDNDTGPRSSGPPRDSEYEVPARVKGSKPSTTAHPFPRTYLLPQTTK